MIGGRPATAATMRRKRRRVGRPSARETSRVRAGAASVPSGMCHPDADRLSVGAQPGGACQRRASRLVVVLDLAIETLEALGRDDFSRRLDRPHGTRVLAQVAGAAALRTPL